jgi:hypothetical protein
MESLKKFLEIGRQHYEKVLLSLVLIGLGGAVYYLYLASQKENKKIQEYMRTQEERPVKGVRVADLTSFQEVEKRLANPPAISLSAPHNLFNPVKWQKRPDGTLFKIESGKEIGPSALSVAAIRPLHMIISVDRPASSGFWMVITNETISPGRPGHRFPQFVSLTATNTRVFVLREVRPPDDPKEWIVELLDSAEKVTITKEQPYQQVIAHEADLKYDAENRLIPKVRAGQKIRLSGEEYNIVAINAKEVLLSAVSNDRRFAIPLASSP